MNATSARIAKLKNCRDETSSSAAMCCTELLQMQKSLATVLKKIKGSQARAAAMKTERYAKTTKNKELSSSVE